MPLQVSSNQRIAVASPYFALRIALAADCLSMLFPCNSEHYLAFPLHLVQDFVRKLPAPTVAPLADATQSTVV